eukprot:SAG31_NODE_7775_length_1599_cov_3.006000_1_plen_82_part_00
MEFVTLPHVRTRSSVGHLRPGSDTALSPITEPPADSPPSPGQQQNIDQERGNAPELHNIENEQPKQQTKEFEPRKFNVYQM